MPIAPSFSVLSSRELRSELPKVVKRSRHEGAASQPVVFGAQRKPEAVVIPFELHTLLLPMIEDLEIAALVRERAAEEGPNIALADVAARFGLDISTL